MGWGRQKPPPSATPCWVWPHINPAKEAFSSIPVSTWGLKVMALGKGRVPGGPCWLCCPRCRAQPSRPGPRWQDADINGWFPWFLAVCIGCSLGTRAGGGKTKGRCWRRAVRGRPQGSSASVTSADVIYFHPSIPGYGERRKIGVSIPSPAPHRIPTLPITPQRAGGAWKFGHPAGNLGRGKASFGNNKKPGKLSELPGLEQGEAFLFVRSKGNISLPRLPVPEQVPAVKMAIKGEMRHRFGWRNCNVWTFF